MNLHLLFNRCLCLIVILGITSFATAAAVTSTAAPLLLAFALPVAVGAWWLSLRRRMLLPRSVVNLLLLAVLAYAALQALSRRFTVDGVAELVVFIQLIKLGDRRAPRDDAQILSLSIFLAIAAMLTSNGLWVGLQLIAFVPLLIATVMLFQLHAGKLLSPGRADAPPAPAPPPAAPLETPGAFRQLRGAVGLSTIAVAVVAVLVFLIMPRGIGENSFGSWRRISTGAVTGFTDRVVLGTRGVISESPRIVLDMVLREAGDRDQPPINIGTSDAIYYLRGAVLDKYSNGVWVPDTSELHPPRLGIQSVYTETFRQTIGSGGRGMISQIITLRDIAGKQAPLFAIWRPVAMDIPGGQREQRIEVDHKNRTVRRSGQSGPYTYTAFSSITEPTAGPEEPVRTPMTFDSPRIHDLAAGILQAGGIAPDPETRPVSDDYRGARAIQNHLQHNYTYTLEEPGAAPGADPIEGFLFNTKQGHCEYFAAAMVAMCRSVGINARMIAGYVAAEFDEANGRYIVRESNAHAWVEAEAGEGRWLRFDPTPPDDLTRIHKARPGLLSRLRRALDSVEYAWNTSIVSFDQSAQQKILGPMQSDEREGFLGRIDIFAQRLRNASPRALMGAVVLGIAVFAAVAAGGLGFRAILPFLTALFARIRPPPGARPAHIPPRFYVQLLALLRDRGLAKPDWQPPLEHATTIDAADLHLGDATRRLATLYYQARFGGRPLSPDQLASARSLLRQLSRRPTSRPMR